MYVPYDKLLQSVSSVGSSGKPKKESGPLWKTYGNFSVGTVDGEPVANNGW